MSFPTEHGDWVVYDTKTGAIRKRLIGRVTEYDFDPRTENYLRGVADPKTQYVLTSSREVRAKEPLRVRYNPAARATANGQAAVITDIPAGTTHDRTTIDDGVLELVFDTPGVHEVTLKHPAFLETTITVDVKEP